MSPYAIKSAKDKGIEILALSNRDYAKLTYKGEDKKFKNVVYENVNPPFLDLKIFPKTEIVYHACEWDKNYLCKDKTNDLIEFLNLNISQISFSFLDEMI